MVFRLHKAFYWLIEHWFIFYSSLYFIFVVLSIFESIRYRKCLLSSIQLCLRLTWFLNNSTIKTNESWCQNDDQAWWCRTICKFNQDRINRISWISFFFFFTIKIDAINSIDLSIDEQRNLVILREDYKN